MKKQKKVFSFGSVDFANMSVFAIKQPFPILTNMFKRKKLKDACCPLTVVDGSNNNV